MVGKTKNFDSFYDNISKFPVYKANYIPQNISVECSLLPLYFWGKNPLQVTSCDNFKAIETFVYCKYFPSKVYHRCLLCNGKE